MPIVNGRLVSSGVEGLVTKYPTAELKFVLSGSAWIGDRFVANDVVRASLGTSSSASSFTVNLYETDTMTPNRWYTVTAEWIDEHDNWVSMSIWEKFYVPEGGGNVADFPNQPLRADAVYVSLSAPPAGFRGYWLHSGPYMPSSSGTGELRRVTS